MGTKEVAFATPLLVWVYDATFVSSGYTRALRERRWLYASLFASWLVLALPLSFHMLFPNDMHNDFTARSPIAYALTQPGVILFYLRLAVWPSPLLIHYEWPLATSAWQVVPPGLVIATLLSATGWALWKRSAWGFLGAWFFAILGPSSSFAALMQNAQGHRMYLSLAAVATLGVLAADAGVRSVAASGVRRRIGFGAVVGAVAVVFIALTWSKNRDFHSEIALWTAHVEHRPESVVAHSNLGRLIAEQGDLDTATRHFERAFEIDPVLSHAHFHLGLAHQRRGDLARAASWYRREIETNPRFSSAWANLGFVLAQLGQTGEAVEHLRRALELKPDDAQALNTLGTLLASVGNRSGAEAVFVRVLEIDPSHARAHFNLGLLYQEQGRLADAARAYERALYYDPGYTKAQGRLAGVRERLAAGSG